MSHPRRLLCLLAAAIMCVGIRPAYAEVDLWPLVEVTDDSTVVLYPLYVHEGDFRMVFPFYYQTNAGRDTHLLWPLIKFSDGRLTRVAPVYFSGNDDDLTIFPLLWRRPTYTAWSIPPVYLRHDRDMLAVLPFYARSEHGLFLFPSYYRSAGEYGSTTRLWPIFYSRQTPSTRSMRILLYLHERSEDWNERMLFPLYYSSRSLHRDEQDLWIFPYYHSQTPEKTRTMVLPVYSRTGSRDGSEKSLYIFPVSLAQSEQRRMFSIFWLFKADRRNLEATGDAPPRVQTDYSALWPVFRRTATATRDGELIHRYRRFLIFSDERDAAGRRFSFFGIPIRERVE